MAQTFRYAFYALQLPWTRAPHWLSSGGGLKNGEFCGVSLVVPLSTKPLLTPHDHQHTMFQYSLSPDDWTHYTPHSPLPSEARLHAPPLFMHANLLKHSQQRFAPGTTFTHLNRVVGGTSKVPDSVARGNLEAMDRVRGSVRKGDIMCVVLSVVDDPDAAGEPEDGDRLRVVDEEWADAWGGVLRDFPAIFWEEGGVAG